MQNHVLLLNSYLSLSFKNMTVTVRVLRVTEKKGCRKKKVLGLFRKATFIRKRKGAVLSIKKCCYSALSLLSRKRYDDLFGKYLLLPLGRPWKTFSFNVILQNPKAFKTFLQKQCISTHPGRAIPSCRGGKAMS